MIKYPNFVDVKNIKCTGSNGYRFSLYIPFNRGGKVLCVIMKNPSTASKLNADYTISKVCNVAFNNGYSSVMVYNLFPFRSTKSNGLITFMSMGSYSKIMKVNLNIIANGCKNRDTVFAWGTNTISSSKRISTLYDNAIKDVISIVSSQTFFVDRCKCAKYTTPCKNVIHSMVRYPLHGLRWHNISRLIIY